LLAVAGVEVHEVGGDEQLGEHGLERRLSRLVADSSHDLVGPVEHQVPDAQELFAALGEFEPSPDSEGGTRSLHGLAHLGVLHVGHAADALAGGGVDRLDRRHIWEVRPAGSVEVVPDSFWVETLGCPKNQVDSDKLTGTLLADGLVPAPAPEDADVVVVNTCAFIEAAREESVETV